MAQESVAEGSGIRKVERRQNSSWNNDASHIGAQIHRQSIGGNVYNTYHFDNSNQEASLVERPDEDPVQLRWRRLHALSFTQSEARYATIKAAHRQTCRWLLNHVEYRNWLNVDKMSEHRGFLWMKGKPGAGKSTVMKFICAQEQLSDTVIVFRFFFNARGVRLERSTEGLYRSLLLQLLKRDPNLQTILDGHDAVYQAVKHRWPLELLNEMIEEALKLSQKHQALVLFIDALDECDDDEVREMVRFFEDLGELAILHGIQLRICLSSRHYPHITVQYGLSIVLEEQKEHQHDIERFVRSELRIGDSDRAQKIRRKIYEKASGVFLWVALVVPMLNKSYDKGQMTAIESLLSAIPSKLEKLFDSILSREGDQTRHIQEQQQMVFCLKCVLYAQRPLSLVELFFAILASTDDSFTPIWNADEMDEDAISRFVLDCSRGLIEETKTDQVVANTDQGVAQFIHETVREYFLNGSRYLDNHLQTTRVRDGEAHDLLKICCWNYLKRSIVDVEKSTGPKCTLGSQQFGKRRRLDLTREWRSIEWVGAHVDRKRLPFISYAVGQILVHSDMACDLGVSQDEFLQSFDLGSWLRLRSGPEDAPEFQELNLSLMYVLADFNLTALLQRCLIKEVWTDIRGGQHGFPLVAARNHRNPTAIRLLLSPQQALESTTSRATALPSEDTYRLATQELLDDSIWDSFNVYHDTPLSFAISHNCFALAECLVMSRRNRLDAFAGYGVCQTTPLREAAGHFKISRMLLMETHAAKGTVAGFIEDGLGYALLDQALRRGDEPLVQVLLGAGDSLTASGHRAFRPLTVVSMEEHADIDEMHINDYHLR